MPEFGPIGRRDLIRYLRKLGFEGPYSGGKHQYMVREKTRLVLPNPHRGDIGRGLFGAGRCQSDNLGAFVASPFLDRIAPVDYP